MIPVRLRLQPGTSLDGSLLVLGLVAAGVLLAMAFVRLSMGRKRRIRTKNWEQHLRNKVAPSLSTSDGATETALPDSDGPVSALRRLIEKYPQLSELPRVNRLLDAVEAIEHRRDVAGIDRNANDLRSFELFLRHIRESNDVELSERLEAGIDSTPGVVVPRSVALEARSLCQELQKRIPRFEAPAEPLPHRHTVEDPGRERPLPASRTTDRRTNVLFGGAVATRSYGPDGWLLIDELRQDPPSTPGGQQVVERNVAEGPDSDGTAKGGVNPVYGEHGPTFRQTQRMASEPVLQTDDAGTRHVRPLSRPGSFGASPKHLGLLHPAFEELVGLRKSFEGPVPEDRYAAKRFFGGETMRGTSLLDRLDRWLFRPFDRAELAPDARVDTALDASIGELERQKMELRREVEGSHGLRSVEPSVGEPFDPSLHDAADTVSGPDQTRDRTIAEVLSHGYACRAGKDDVLLKRPRVHVYVYEPTGPSREGARVVRVEELAVEEPEAEESAHVIASTAPHEGLLTVHFPESWYLGESLRVVVGWRATRKVRAWLEIGGDTYRFGSVFETSTTVDATELSLNEYDGPLQVSADTGVVVVEDVIEGVRRRAEGRFEVPR